LRRATPKDLRCPCCGPGPLEIKPIRCKSVASRRPNSRDDQSGLYDQVILGNLREPGLAEAVAPYWIYLGLVDG